MRFQAFKSAGRVGIGHARKPPLYMKLGDVCEVEIEGLGMLSNPIADES